MTRFRILIFQTISLAIDFLVRFGIVRSYDFSRERRRIDGQKQNPNAAYIVSAGIAMHAASARAGDGGVISRNA